jgi:hypothetical protein
MNDRIRELKKQAGIDFNPDQEGLDLFAELIVLECIEINRQELAFAAFERLLNQYQAHFGVE